jgi:type IV pilus assembly protein PilF
LKPKDKERLMSLHKLLLTAAIALALGGCGASSAPRTKSTQPTARQDAAEVQVKLGRGYMEQGKFETAHEKLERALELDPTSVDGNTLMAVLYERIDRPALAEKHYRRAAELDAEDGSTNNNLGAYLCRLSRFDEADAYFRKALDDPFYATPQAALSNAGVCAVRAGAGDKAEAYFRRSLEINPRDPASLYELALLNFKKGEFMRARAFVERFESGGKPDASMLELAAKIEEQLGDAKAAAKYRDRLKTEFPNHAPGPASEGSKSP